MTLDTSHTFPAQAVCALLDERGAPLTEVEVSWTGQGRLAIARAALPAALLAHYFGHGNRTVLIDTTIVRVRGQLSTRWMNSRRCWWVDLLEGSESTAARRPG